MSEMILSGGFDAGFAMRLMMKDLDGYGRLAREAGVPSPVARVAAEVYRLAMGWAMGEQDHTAIARRIEEAAGVTLRVEGGRA
jgi:3-hydroxyisobutyrate dehydrogenase